MSTGPLACPSTATNRQQEIYAQKKDVKSSSWVTAGIAGPWKRAHSSKHLPPFRFGINANGLVAGGRSFLYYQTQYRNYVYARMSTYGA